MQSKKRAKPVKFGKASNVKKEKVELSKKDNNKIDEVVEEKVEELKVKEDKAEEAGEAKEENVAGKGAVSTQASAETEESDIALENGKEEAVEVEDDLGETKNETEDKIDDKIDEEVLTDEEIVDDDADDEDLGDDEVFAKPPGDTNKKGVFGYFMKVVIITFLIALVFFAGGYYAYTNQEKLLGLVSTPSPTPAQVPDPTPTIEPVNLAEFSIIVLNGTDVAGLATDTQELLEDAGFEVISVGNAVEDYEETEIQAIEAVSDAFLKELESVLSKSFTIGSRSEIASGDADIIINLGSPSASLN